MQGRFVFRFPVLVVVKQAYADREVQALHVGQPR